jgi:retron-type reverse transcriptase
VRDRVLQTAVALVLEPLFEAEFEDCSFAYRKGRSVDQALQRVQILQRQGYHWVVDADIDSFFDNIDHALLLERLAELIKDAGILNLIRLWLHAEIADGGLRYTLQKGIPQGALCKALHNAPYA